MKTNSSDNSTNNNNDNNVCICRINIMNVIDIYIYNSTAYTNVIKCICGNHLR